PDSGELPGQRHHRPAHRELRVLAGCEGRSRTAARRHAVELGDAALGGLSNGARDLVGDPVSLRPDGMDTAHLGTVPRRGTVNRVGPLVGVLIAVLSASPTVRLCGQDTTAGKKVYEKWCAGCHGDTGAGDGPSAPTLKDDAGFPIYAADLHENWRFRGGGTVEDIYHRLRTGLDGTPMPSFSDLIEQKFLTDEQLWRLAQYVRSLSPARTP